MVFRRWKRRTVELADRRYIEEKKLREQNRSILESSFRRWKDAMRASCWELYGDAFSP
jgi:hypothetical protein